MYSHSSPERTQRDNHGGPGGQAFSLSDRTGRTKRFVMERTADSTRRAYRLFPVA